MRQKPKKSLGQNFLVDKNIQRKIIDACVFKPEDIVLEIGAGRGELSCSIAERVAKIYALEIDASLCQIIEERLRKYKNAKIINRDILEFNLRRHFARHKDKIKVIGNIPYYITTPIIEHLLRYRDKIGSVYLTVQKEVAERMTASAGSREYGSFSCFVQYYTEARKIFLIKRNCFYPAPGVDSCFLRLGIREKPALELKDERLFFRIIRAAFGKRRKTLRNSLRGVISSGKLERFFIQYDIDADVRPETLTLKDFANLTNTQG